MQGHGKPGPKGKNFAIPRPDKIEDARLLNWHEIRKLAGIGLSMPEIAAVKDCAENTLRKHYMDAIEEGRQDMKASLKRRQFEAAMEGNVTMLIWLGKQHLGQTDKAQLEHKQQSLPELLAELGREDRAIEGEVLSSETKPDGESAH